MWREKVRFVAVETIVDVQHATVVVQLEKIHIETGERDEDGEEIDKDGEEGAGQATSLQPVEVPIQLRRIRDCSGSL